MHHHLIAVAAAVQGAAQGTVVSPAAARLVGYALLALAVLGVLNFLFGKSKRSE